MVLGQTVLRPSRKGEDSFAWSSLARVLGGEESTGRDRNHPALSDGECSLKDHYTPPLGQKGLATHAQEDVPGSPGPSQSSMSKSVKRLT